MDREITALRAANKALEAQLATCQALPTNAPQEALPNAHPEAFSHADAANFKVEVLGGIALEIKRFEALITAQGTETSGKPKHPPRRAPRTRRVTFAAPVPALSATPTRSAPNIIDLVANMQVPPSGLLLECEVDKPSPSSPHKPHVPPARVASIKGKEKAPPSVDPFDWDSLSDDTEEPAENESADSILVRQVALVAQQEPAEKATAAPTTSSQRTVMPGGITTVTKVATPPVRPVTTAGPKPAPPLLKPVSTPQTAPRASLAPRTKVVDKSLWIYVSNIGLPARRRGWRETHPSWQTQLATELGLLHLPVDLRKFSRVFPAIHDPRLVLEATTPLDRRALYMAIKTCHSMVRAHLHLTPQCKANKTLVYFTARRQQVDIDDRGDIICLSWKSDHTRGVRIEVGRSAAEVEATMATFLDAPPRPPANRIPEWR